MANTVTPVYGTPVTITITLASLANSATAGRASTAIANTTDLAVDCTVGGRVTTGAGPTTNNQIQIWVYGSYDGTIYTAGASGTDAALTPNYIGLLFPLQSVVVTNTSSATYNWGPFSVAQAFGGTMPRSWGIWVLNNSGVALSASSSNHEIKYTPVKYQSA